MTNVVRPLKLLELHLQSYSVLAIWLGLPVCFHSASASTLKFAVSNNCLNHGNSVVMNVCRFACV
jgi:hypothetical protein